MTQRIIFLNIIYYAIIIGLIGAGRSDPSSSLGYGYFLMIFLGLSFIALIILGITKFIYPRSLLDKIGFFMLTPVLSMLCISIIANTRDIGSSERYFDLDNHRYKVKEIDSRRDGGRRIEFYKSRERVDPKDYSLDQVWVKDSAWIYLSEYGDTVKKVRYKDDVEIK